MRAPGSAIRFVAIAVVSFVVLMAIAPWKFYPPLFQGVANVFFSSFGSHRIAKFEPSDDPRGMWDTKISVGSDVSGAPAYGSSLGFNSVREGYAPTAALLALVLATPAAWRRGWGAVAAAFGLIQVFVALRIVVAALYGFSRVGLGDRHLLEVGTLGMRALRRADQILTGDLHFTYIAPLLVWLLVVVRPEAIRSLWNR